tara:strand:+ start:63 stop:251 length:189 start_codon:yes stop_codon:yes gene_type:complete
VKKTLKWVAIVFCLLGFIGLITGNRDPLTQLFSYTLAAFMFGAGLLLFGGLVTAILDSYHDL